MALRTASVIARMRHVIVFIILFAQNSTILCIASSSHLSNVKRQDYSFSRHRATRRTSTTIINSWLPGVTTLKTPWSDMIHTTRGGSSYQLAIEDDELCDLPDQVDESAIEMLVKEIIQDKDTNILLLPDKIEAGLYRSTVRLTLNAIYTFFRKSIDGRRFLLGHRLKLRHYPASSGKTDTFRRASSSHVDMKVLEEVADGLLQNKNINQPLIPDILERQIYINCLKVVMRILDIVHGSFQVTFCGHSVRLLLTNSTSTAFSENSVRRASSIISKVSRKDLLKYQKDAGIIEEENGWLSFWGKQKRAMTNQVQATMFGLVVQILQDMLDQSTIELVGVGKIFMDLIPPSSGNEMNKTMTFRDEDRIPITRRPRYLVRSTRKSRFAFVSGMGVGAILVVLLFKQIESPDGTINLRQLSRNLQHQWCTQWARLRTFVPWVPKRQSKDDITGSNADEPPMIQKRPFLLNPFRRRDLQTEKATNSDSTPSSDTK